MTNLKTIPKTNRKELLATTVALVKAKKVAFVGTSNEYVWKAEEGDFKWTLTRSKDCKFCLAVYGGGPAVFIRSSGGELQGLFYDLIYYARLHEETVFSADLLKQLDAHFGGA